MYKIESYTVTIEGKEITKYKISYFGGEFDGLSEFYAIDLNEPQTNIRFGYTKHPDSL
jgi:hypothetical protein